MKTSTRAAAFTIRIVITFIVSGSDTFKFSLQSKMFVMLMFVSLTFHSVSVTAKEEQTFQTFIL